MAQCVFVARGPETRDHADGNVRKIGTLPERLAGVDIGQVNFDERQAVAVSASRRAILVCVKAAGLMMM
jgi:hypothetical protein